jgi:hypothetical protein
MPIDDDLKKAVEEATKQLGQPKSVSLRFTKWLQDMSERSLDSREELQHLTALRDALNVPADGDNL